MAEVRAELARLDVGRGQLRSDLQDVRAEQSQLPEQLKTLRQEVAALSHQQGAEQAQLMALQGDLLTLALDQSSPEGKPGTSEPSRETSQARRTRSQPTA